MKMDIEKYRLTELKEEVEAILIGSPDNDSPEKLSKEIVSLFQSAQAEAVEEAKRKAATVRSCGKVERTWIVWKGRLKDVDWQALQPGKEGEG